MSSNPNSSEITLNFSLGDLFRKLAFEHSQGQKRNAHTWNSIRIKHDAQIDVHSKEIDNKKNKKEPSAEASYNSNNKTWKINRIDKLKHQGPDVFGVTQNSHGDIHLVKLPNNTAKNIVAVVDAKSLIDALTFNPSQDKSKATVASSSQFPVTAVSPSVGSHSYSLQAGLLHGGVHEVTHHQKYFEYSLFSPNNKSDIKPDLSWQRNENGLIYQSGSDVADLSKYKDILLNLRHGLLQQNIKLPEHRQQQLEKRLLLLEQQIEGLMRRKIHYTSKDHSGHRFLDYTSLLNDKENQIIELHKKIDNLTVRLNKADALVEDYKKQIQRLGVVVKTVQNPNLKEQDVHNLLLSNFEAVNRQKNYGKMKGNLNAVNSLLKSHFDDLKLKGVQVEHEDKIKKMLEGDDKIQASIVNNILHIVETKDRQIQVPVQDPKTQALLKSMTEEMRRLHVKYPKLKQETDPHLYELYSKEVSNVVQMDGLSKITDIVRYVPQMVKVQNVYNYSNEKDKRTEFHLRVLLKALLQQFDKIKKKTGAVPQIDESVVTMIHQQIGDVNADDILKTFQVNHKIVEVPKLLEKVVDRVIEVPTLYPYEKIVEKVVENTKIVQIQKVVHVPVEVIKYVDRIVEKIVEVQKIKQKIVEVPRIIEKIVQKRIQVPKIIEVEVIKQKIVQVQKPVQIIKTVNHVMPEIQEITVEKQKTVVVKEVEQKIVQVEKIVEKIVERVVQKPVIKQIEKIVEKLVHTIEYKSAREVINHIEKVPQIIERIVQKIVPVIQTVQKIVEVEKIVQKIVEVRVEVPIVKQVIVNVEKIVYKDRVKQIQKVVNISTPLVKQVQKIVEKRVQVPIIQQVLVKVPQLITQIVIQKSQNVTIKQVQRIVQKIVQVTKIIEVQKPIFKYITVQKPIKVIVETFIQVPKIIQRIKEVKVFVDRIVQKLVEVPKVVEVQKIVEKIIVVPRIIEKIVEVPQIVQKIIEKIIQVEKIREIIKQVKIPIIQQKIVEVEKIVNVPVKQVNTVEKLVEKIVKVENTKEVIKPVDVIKQKIIEKRVQIPKQIVKDKIVSNRVEVQKIVEIQKSMVIPFEVPVPFDKIVEKLVVVEKVVQKIKQVTKLQQKNIPIIEQKVTVKQIPRLEQKIVYKQTIKQVQKIVPYITQKIKQIQITKQKPTIVIKIEQKLVEVPKIQQKVVVSVHEVPKIYQVQKVVQKLVEVPKYIQITAKQPMIITCNKIVEKIIQKIVEVPLIHQQIVEVPRIQQKIVSFENLIQTIKEIVVNKDKIVERQKLIHKTDITNNIQTKHQIVDRFEEKLVPVHSSTEKILQIPHILQKVVERIILMPQVHEVLKHVVDVRQRDSLVAVDVDFATHEANYKKIYGNLKTDMGALMIELNRMKQAHPQLKQRLEIIQKYLIDLDKLSEFPKIIQVNKDKIVEKEVSVPVVVSRRDSDSTRSEAFYLVLIEQLITQIKRIKQKNPKIELELDDSIKSLFFTGKKSDQKLKDKLDGYKFSKGNETLYKAGNKQQFNNLISGVLNDKFYLASMAQKANLEIERNRKLAEQRLSLLHQFKQSNDLVQQRLRNLEQKIHNIMQKASLHKQCKDEMQKILLQIEQIDKILYSDIKNAKISEPVQFITQINGESTSKLYETRIRQLETEIELLRSKLKEVDGGKSSNSTIEDKDRIIYSLREQISHMIASNQFHVSDYQSIKIHDEKGTRTTIGGKSVTYGNNVTSLEHLQETDQKRGNEGFNKKPFEAPGGTGQTLTTDTKQTGNQASNQNITSILLPGSNNNGNQNINYIGQRPFSYSGPQNSASIDGSLQKGGNGRPVSVSKDVSQTKLPGQQINQQGFLINQQGQPINNQGQIINPQSQLINQSKGVQNQQQFILQQGQPVNWPEWQKWQQIDGSVQPYQRNVETGLVKPFVNENWPSNPYPSYPSQDNQSFLQQQQTGGFRHTTFLPPTTPNKNQISQLHIQSAQGKQFLAIDDNAFISHSRGSFANNQHQHTQIPKQPQNNNSFAASSPIVIERQTQENQYNQNQTIQISQPSILQYPTNKVETSRTGEYTSKDQIVVDNYANTGQFNGKTLQGGTYSASFLYTSEAKSFNTDEKVQSKTTELKGNQVVNWKNNNIGGSNVDPKK